MNKIGALERGSLFIPCRGISPGIAASGRTLRSSLRGTGTFILPAASRERYYHFTGEKIRVQKGKELSLTGTEWQRKISPLNSLLIGIL